MLRYAVVLFLLLCGQIMAQETYAREYFKNGEFEKALFEYQKLHKKQPHSLNYILRLTEIYRQLERYDEAEGLLKNTLSKINFPALYVELGYNFQLKNNESKASEHYQKALSSLDDNVSNVYQMAKRFEDYSLLDYAISAYQKAKSINPDLNFEIKLARIYGEQGDVEKMFDAYLNFLETNDKQVNHIKRCMGAFVTEDSANENNQILRKLLLKKIQTTQNLTFNHLLSWLFVQQREFNKSFAQEKAIFNRHPESLNRLEELAKICQDANAIETARGIYSYLIDTAQDNNTVLTAHYNLLQMDTKTVQKKDYNKIKQRYTDLFDAYGMHQQTLPLQVAYAHFTAFYLDKPDEASQFLKARLEQPLSLYQEASIKMELGDILVFQEKFNEALIYFTQIQRKLKNSTLSQDARFKVAKASYYKGDFDWAESQLNILKSSTSQLIANDALDLKLTISDNKYEDSTQAALKLYAKADLLSFQNKNTEAIGLLAQILANHKGESIEDQALFKQAKLFEKQREYTRAEGNYKSIIENFNDDILADDAHFALAELYNIHLAQPELAKQFYEQIVFNFPNSIYFVEARNKFRLLRGDAIN